MPQAFALGVSKGKALKKCAKQQLKPPTVLKRRLNILKEMLGLFQFLQKHLPNPLPHFQALFLETQHLGTLNENSMVSWTTLCEHKFIITGHESIFPVKNTCSGSTGAMWNHTALKPEESPASKMHFTLQSMCY